MAQHFTPAEWQKINAEFNTSAAKYGLPARRTDSVIIGSSTTSTKSYKFKTIKANRLETIAALANMMRVIVIRLLVTHGLKHFFLDTCFLDKGF